MPERGLTWRHALAAGVVAAGGVLVWPSSRTSAPPAAAVPAAVVPIRAAPVEPVADAADAEPPAARIIAGDPADLRKRFDALRWSETQPVELAALAREIDDALPMLAGRGTVGAGDALMLKADLLDVLELDPVKRRARLHDWWRSHPVTSRPLAPGDARVVEEERREQVALDEWQAQRSEDRDAGELIEKLQDMRAVLSARTH